MNATAASACGGRERRRVAWMPRHCCALVAASVAAVLAAWPMGPGAVAADVVKADNTTALNVGSSWSSGTAPSTSDRVVWDSTVTSANSVSLGANTTWNGGIWIKNPTGGVTLTGNFTLTTSTITLDSGASLTISNSTAALSFNGLAGSGTLTINKSNTLTAGFATANSVNFTGALVLRGGTAMTSAGTAASSWIAFGSAGVSQAAGTSFALDTGASTTDAKDIIFTDAWSGKTITLSSLTGYGAIRRDGGVANNMTIKVDQSTTTTFNGLILAHTSVAGAVRSIDFVKAGTGALTLAGLVGKQTASAGGAAAPVNIEVTGGTLVMQADNTTTGSLTVRTGGLLRMENGSASTNFTGGNSSMTGNYTIDAGGEVQAFRNGSAAFGTGTMVMNGGSLFQTGGNWTWTNAITLNTLTSSTIGNKSATGPRNLKLQGVIGGSGNVTFNDPVGGITSTDQGIILTGANTMSGTVTVDTYVRVGGVTGNDTSLNAGTGGTLGTATLSINSGKVLTFSRSDAITVSNTIGGAGAVSIGSTGITGANTQSVTLSASNSYGGGTTLNTGTLNIGNQNAIGTGTFTIAGGSIDNTSGGAITLATNNPQSWSGDFTFVGSNSLNLGSGTVVLSANRQVTVTSSALTVGGGVSGAFSLTKAGAGALTLSGSNSYSGATTVTGGTLSVGADNNLGAAPGTATAGSLVLNGGVLAVTSGFTLSTNRSIALGPASGTATGTIDVAAGQVLTVGGTIANNGAGTGNLTKNGVGTLTLAGVNTYSGTTTVTGGTLSVASDSSLGTAPGAATAGQLVLNGGSLAVTTGFTLASNRGMALGPTSGSGAGSIDVASGQTLTYGGIAANNGAGTGSLTKTGAGALLLSQANTYGGATTITSGTLIVNAVANGGAASGIGQSSNAAANLVLGSAAFVLDSSAAAQSTDRLFTLAGSGTILNSNATAANTLTFSNTGAIVHSGGGARTLTLGGANTGANAFALALGDNTVDSSVVSLAKANAGTWSITGTANTYTGASTLVGGVVNVQKLAAGGSASSLGASTNVASNLVINGVTLVYLGGGDTTDRAFSLQASSIIRASGSGALTWTGTGVAFPTANNAYTLTLGGTSTAANVFGTPLTDNGSGAITLAKSDGGTWALTGSNSHSGGTTLNAGILSFGTNTLGTGTVTLNGGTLQWAASNSQDLSARLALVSGSTATLDTNGNAVTFATGFGGSTSGALVKIGSGTLTLSASNSYTGGTTLSAGQLNINNARALGTGAFTIAGGTIDNTSGAATTVSSNNTQSWNGDFTFAGSNPLNLGTGAVTLGAARTVTVTSSTLTVGGAIGGAFSLTKGGAGTILLNGANGFTGGFVLTGGTAIAGNGRAFGSNGTTSGAITIRDGTLDLNGQFNYTHTNGSVREYLLNNKALTFGGAAGGVMTLADTAATPYGFGVFDTNGVIVYDATNNPGTATVSAAWRGVGASGIVNKTVTVGDSTATSVELDFTGQMSMTTTDDGSQTTIQKLGAGTMRISAANFFPGLRVTAGTLIVNNVNALGSLRTNNGTVNNLVTVDGGTLDLNGFSPAIGGLTGATGTITNNAVAASILTTGSSGTTATYGGTIKDATGTVALVKQGTGALTLSGSNSYSGGTTLSSGTIVVGNAFALGSTSGPLAVNAGVLNLSGSSIAVGALSGSTGALITTANAAGTATLTTNVASGASTYSGTIADNGSGFVALTKAGAGTLMLSASNAYSGATTISGGTLSVSSDSNLGTAPGGFTAGQLAINNGSLSASAGFTLNSNRGIVLGPAAGDGDGTIHVAAGTLVYGGTVSNNGSGADGLVKAGPGRLQLTGINTYTGMTTISSGTLEIGGAGQLNAGSYAGPISNSGALSFTTSANQTLSGGVTGVGSLAKTGAGRLTLLGNNTYAGPTTVSSGSLVVNGVVTSSTTTVSGGAVLGGSGTMANVTLSGGVVSPGNSPGNLTVGNMSWDSTSSYVWQMYDYNGGEGTGWDMITGTGALSISGTGFTFNLVSLSGTDTQGPLLPERWSQTTSGTFRVATFAGGITGATGQWWQVTGAGSSFTPFSSITGSFSVTTTTNDVLLVYTYTPPPAYVWTGGSGAWSDAANWQLNDPTTPAGTVDIIFSGAGGTSTNDLTSGTGTGQLTTVTSLTFSGSASGAYTVTGSSFTLGSGGIVNQSPFTQTVQNDLVLGAVSLVNAQTADLVVSGSILTSGNTLSVTGSNNTTLSGVVSGSGGLAKQGTGVLTLTGSNNYTGGTTITVGTLVVGDGGTNGVLPGNVTNNAALAFNRSDDNTFGGNIGGTGSLTKLGSNTLTLSGSNSWSGATTISGGTLALSSAASQTLSGAISGAGALSQSGAGTLTLTGSSGYTGGTTITGGTLQLGSGGTAGSITGDVSNGGVLVFNRSDAVTFAGAISGAGSLRQSGSGATTLTGTSTYTGSTTIASGTLVMGGAGVLGGGSYSNTIANAGVLSYASSANQTLAGGVSGVGSLSVSGPGSLTLSASNSYSGGTTITSGAVVVTSTSGFGTGAATVNGGVLSVTGAGSVGPALVTLNSGTIRVGNNTALGTGTVTLAGGELSSADTTARTLANVVAVTGNVTLGDTLNTGTLTFSGSFGLTGGSRTITADSDVTVSGVVNNGGLVKAGAGALTLANANTHALGTTLSAGTIRIGNVAALGTGTATLNGGALSSDSTTARAPTNNLVIGGDVTLGDATNNGALTFSGSVGLGGATRQITTPSDVTMSGVLYSGGLTKAGGATLTLTAANTYTGATTINSGTLRFTGSGAVASSSGISIASGAAFEWGRDGNMSVGLSGSGTVMRSTTTGNAVFNGANSGFQGAWLITSGYVGLANDSSVGAATVGITMRGGAASGIYFTTTGQTLAASRTVTLEGAGGTLNGSTGDTGTFAAVFTGTGNLSKVSGATAVLTGTNDFTGSISITTGILEIGSAGKLGGTSGLYGGNITNGAALTFSTSENQSLSGTISGAGALNKSGAGTLSLTNAGNTSTGNATITGGTLSFVNGALGSSGAVSMNGGTLKWATGNTQDLGARLTLVAAKAATLDTNGNDVTLGTAFAGGAITASVTKIGAGALTLSAANTFTGGVTLSVGQLNINNATAIGTGTLTIAGGTIDNTSANAITLSSNNPQAWNSDFTFVGTRDLNLGTGAVTLNANRQVTVSGSTLTVGGAIGGGAYALTKAGAGTLVLTGASTFSGATTVSGGTLTLSGGQVRSTSSFTVNAGATANINSTNWLTAGHGTPAADGQVITVNGGAIVFSSTNVSRIGNVTLTNGGTFTSNRALSASDILLANVSSGTWATVTVSGNAAATMNGSGGLRLLNTQNFSVSDVTGDATADLTVSLVLGDPSGGTGGFNKSGAGTMLLTGTNAFTGAITVAAGTLEVGGAGVLNSGSYAGAITNNAALVFSTSANQTLSGVIGGSGLLTKSGAGTLVLTGVNTYAGDTAISSGTLQIGGSGQLGSGAYAGVITNAGVLDYASAASQTLSGTITGAGSLRKSGAGTLTLSGSSSFTGGLTIAGGTVQVGDNGTTGSLAATGAIEGSAGATLAFLRTDTLTQGSEFGSVIAGSINVSQLGSGTLVLNGANTYTGTTRIVAGSLSIAGALALQNSTLDMNGSNAGTVAAIGQDSTLGGLMGSRNLDMLGRTLSIGNNGQSTTYSGLLSNGSLTKVGAGTLTLSASNAYTGATTVSAGTLALSGSGNFGPSPSLNLSASGATLDISSASGNRTVASLTGAAGSRVILGSNSLTAGDAANTTFSGTISGGGGFTKTGAGMLTLGGASTYSGATAIQSGTVKLGLVNAIPAASAITLGSAGSMATLDLDNHDLAISSLTFAGVGGTLPNAAGTVTLQNLVTGTARITVSSGTSNEFHPDVTLSSTTVIDVALNASLLLHASLYGSAPLTKTGVGLLQIFGNNEAYTGAISLTGGTTQLLGGNATLGSGTTTVYTGATLDFNNRPFVGTYVIDGGNVINISSGSTTVVISGASTISGTSTAADFLVTSTGSAAFDLALTSTSVVTVDLGGRATFNGSVAGLVDAHGTSTFASSVLGGANIQVGSGSTSGATAAFAGDLAHESLVTVNAGALATFTGTAAGSITTSGTVDLTGRVTSTGGITVNSGGIARILDNALYDAADIENAGSLVVDRTANFTLAAAIDGVGSLTKQGAGTLTLTAASTYSGATTISAGTVSLSGSGAIGGAVALAAATGLDISAADGNRTIGLLTGSTGSQVLLGSNTLTAGGSGTTTFAGTIAGSGGFTKAGSGVLTLTSAQDFTGRVSIAAGILVLQGSGTMLQSANSIYVASGAVLDATSNGLTVGSSQTLGGYGTITGAVAFTSGATLSPGGSVGLLTNTGSDTFNGGMHYTFEVNDANGVAGGPNGWDLYSISGGLTLAAGSSLENQIVVDLTSLSGTESGWAANFNSNYDYAWKFLVAGNEIATFNKDWFRIATTGFNNTHDGTFYVARGDQMDPAFGSGTSKELFVVYASVPEPGTLALAGIGLAAAGWAASRRQRRRRRS